MHFIASGGAVLKNRLPFENKDTNTVPLTRRASKNSHAKSQVSRIARGFETVSWNPHWVLCFSYDGYYGWVLHFIGKPWSGTKTSFSVSGVLKRMEWLLELMGYIRNLAYQSTSVQNVALDEVQSRGVTCGFLKMYNLCLLSPTTKKKVAACLLSTPSPHFLFIFGK